MYRNIKLWHTKHSLDGNVNHEWMVQCNWTLNMSLYQYHNFGSIIKGNSHSFPQLCMQLEYQFSCHANTTHYKWSHFQEWNLGSKVCICSCQQCCCILRSRRDQYPADIHQYLERGINQQLSHKCMRGILLHLHMHHVTITCAVESISLIATYTAAIVTSNGIDAVSISITVIETIQLTLINI